MTTEAKPITDRQRSYIAVLFTGAQWRIEAMEFLLHRRSLDEVTTEEARSYLVIRHRYIKWMRKGEFAAEVSAERARTIRSMPELYAAFTGIYSHRITQAEADYLIRWLKGQQPDWSLRRTTTRTTNPTQGERKWN